MHPRIAEIGVYRGATSACLLAQDIDLRLVMVDLWPSADTAPAYHAAGGTTPKVLANHADEVYQDALDRTQFAASRRTVLRIDSVAAAGGFRFRSFDLVFIDADHRKETVAADIEAWWSRVRIGGWLCGHDYRDLGVRFGVKTAVTEFSVLNNLPVEVVNRCWFIKRPPR